MALPGIHLVCRKCKWEFKTESRKAAIKAYREHWDACQNLDRTPRIWVWSRNGKSLFEGRE